MNNYEEKDGCSNCGYWQCSGCGDYDHNQLERERLWEDLEEQIDDQTRGNNHGLS